MVERDEGEGGLWGPNQRVPSNRPTVGALGSDHYLFLGSSALRETLRGARVRGGVGGLYYIYEALSKQSNNIDSAPRSDRPSQRTPSHGPFYARYILRYRRAHGALILFTRALSTLRLFISFGFRL